MSSQRKITYRTGLFDPVNLNSIDKIADALTQFEAVLNEDNYVHALDDLLDNTQIIELILSGMSDSSLNRWIVEHFPTTHDLFISSFENKLLCKLSKFLIFHTSPDDVDHNVLRDHHRTVSLAPEALRALFAMTSLQEEGHPPNVDKPGLSKKVKAKSPKQLKIKKTHVRELNTKPLDDLNIAIPRNSTDAQATLTMFLVRLQDILQFYLNRMLSPQIVNSIKDSFIPDESPTELKIVTDSRLSIDTPDTSVPPVPITENLPVYPMIQPMKSALFFDSPEGFGEWRVLVSQAAHNDLRYFRRKSKKSFKIITKKIKEISNGFFSEDNQKRINGSSPTDIPIFEAKMTRDLRLVYIVDCVSHYDNASEIQVLKLIGISTHTQINKRSWEDLGRALGRRGKNYRERCIKRVRVSNCSNVFPPAHFPGLPMVDSPSLDVPDLPEEDSSNELHKIITLEKYVTFSKELLDSIEADRDDAFPFEVSQKERAIIEHPYSCYVLGRSGTGKTTTMLFKMLWIERAYRMSGEGLVRPRQVFVTQSRVLVGKVEEHFFKYLESLAAGSSEHQDAYKRISNCDLDDGFLVDEDDNGEWRNDLPQKFSELEDHHFPLFIAFDTLCTMLETDIRCKEENVSSQALTGTLPMMPGHRVSDLRTRGKLVNLDRFLSEYWPHFSQSLTKKLNASSVFSEIMGVISGSEQTAKMESGYLDRDTYENSSLRGQSTFADHRSRIYDIFLSYRQRKMNLGDFDAAERTHAILRSFAGAPLMGKKFDHLYVDETQDNLLIDTLLLRSLSRSPNGLFWAGDTAQTISAGSSFRFADLKAFLYRIEKRHHLINSDKLIGPIQRPLTFQLAVNYRSHAGIVNCAHTVINLITQLWPNSIDKMERERGVANGIKPIFYTEVDSDFIKEGRFLSRNMSRDKIELGADQCILVRNDKARRLLVDEVGKVGIILTIYESKGLEFNDVFLYNFFHDSEYDASLWRVVLNGIDFAHAAGIPVFDAVKHAGICSELKFLYVAITRARNNLRIADFSTKGEPMRKLWLSRGQIQSCLPGNDLADFAAPSSKEDWEKRAKELFNLKQYAHAEDSFMKANNRRSAAVANAYVRQDIAQKMPNRPGNSNSSRLAAFESAAQAFLVCARDALEGGSVKYKLYYQLAAQCFEEAGNIIEAAEDYRIAENFTKAILLFRKLGKFDDVYNIITNHSDKVTLEVLESVKDVTRLYYLTEKKFREAHTLFVTVEEEISYLEDRNFGDAHLDLLMLYEKKSDAAEVHLSEGRVLEAIDLFLDDNENRQGSFQRAVNCILEGLRKAIPLGGYVARLEVTELFKRSDLLDPCVLSQDVREEIDLFKAISSGCDENFIRRANIFLNSGNTHAELLCLDRQFEHTPDFTDMDIFQMACVLQLFLRYAEMLHDLAFSADPCTESHVWTLFGYRPHEQDTFWIPAGTLLYTQVPAEEFGSTSEEGLILSRRDLLTVFQKCLRGRLLDRVVMENDKCRVAPALTPCLHHVVYRDCNRPICKGAHIFPDQDWFSSWTRVHFLQILIYHTIIHLQFRAEMKAQQRYWIGKLQQVLNASDFRYGSYSNLDDHTIAVARKPLKVVIDWVRQVAVSLEHDWPPDPSFLTHAMVTANIAFTFDRNEASVYLYRSEFISSGDCPDQYFRYPHGENTIQEFLVALHEKGPSSVVNGILFIRHVMEAKIPVEIGVFCSFIERICGSLIACNRYRRTGSLHGVTLPRSWLKVILDTFQPTEASEKDSLRFWLLLQPLENLLRSLYYNDSSNPGHLLYDLEFRWAERQPTKIRSLYIARICRILGLLGYNIRVPAFREEILGIFKSLLGSNHHGFSSLYGRYIYAESFEGIAKATRRSMQGSPLDEMVQLLQSDRIQSPVYVIFGLRSVTYSMTEEIPSLLADLPSQCPSSSQMPPSDNSVKGVNVDLEGENVENDLVDTLNEADEISHDDEEEVDPDFIPQTDLPEVIYTRHSENEKSAAIVIQRAYRNALKQRRLRKKPGPKGQIRLYFHLCWKRVREDNRKGDYYTRAFLGLLPHLLSSLDSAEFLAIAKKQETRKLLVPGSRHEPFDDISANLTCIAVLLKNIKACRQKLLPTAELHRDYDLDSLKKHVGHAIGLLSESRLPFEVTDDLRTSIGLVYKGLFQEKIKVEVDLSKTSKKERKPNLNTDDSLDLGRDVEDDWSTEE